MLVVLDQPGLSPRVRGNPAPLPTIPKYLRSIPACTGEPDLTDEQNEPLKVYPRVYGGTP